MQTKLGGPRSALTTAEVDEVLLHAAGARIRWGVVILDSAGNPRGPVVLNESTDEDWEAGVLAAGLLVLGGSVTGSRIDVGAAITVNAGVTLTVNTGQEVTVNG